MNEEDARDTVILYWLRMADESLESARSEAAAGRFTFAVNRVYYACFYSASAVLLKRGYNSVKHSGLRGALHRFLVKPGELDPKWGRFYDRSFNSRQQSDYQEFIRFNAGQVAEMIEQAEGFIAEMKRVLNA